MKNSGSLRKMEVIDINTAEKLGVVSDIDVDIKTGQIKSIVLPNKEFFLFSSQKSRELVIPWTSVRAVGREHILVNVETLPDLSR